MSVNLDYDLLPERIALYPTSPRDKCRLLVINLRDFYIEDKIFTDITDYFSPGDAIAVNNSKVINARLYGKKTTGAKLEFLLLLFKDGLWQAMARPASRLRENMEVEIFSKKSDACKIKIIKKNPDGTVLLQAPANILEYGYIPLPPYILSRRELREDDGELYQTNFAQTNGSVASPTSALHFTPGLIDNLKTHGVDFAEITLHVGAGTFRVKYDKPDPEQFELTNTSADIINNAGKLCVCGTTVMRTLETVYDRKQQKYIPLNSNTDLFIEPGHQFGPVDMFLTNFHLPGTPLLKLVAAFIEQSYPGQGARRLMEIYKHAMAKQYRFLSYGDAMLIIK